MVFDFFHLCDFGCTTLYKKLIVTKLLCSKLKFMYYAEIIFQTVIDTTPSLMQYLFFSYWGWEYPQIFLIRDFLRKFLNLLIILWLWRANLCTLRTLYFYFHDFWCEFYGLHEALFEEETPASKKLKIIPVCNNLRSNFLIKNSNVKI